MIEARKEGTYFVKAGRWEERIDMTVRVMLLWVWWVRIFFLINDFLFFVSFYLPAELFVSLDDSAVSLNGWFLIYR